MTEERSFYASVLKIGADGSSLARNTFTTPTRLCVTLPSGGITRTILIDRIEAVSLSLAPAESKTAINGKAAEGVNNAVVVIANFRVVGEPSLVLRLATEGDALRLVKALNQSPHCTASFHTPEWTSRSSTGREKAAETEADGPSLSARPPAPAETREEGRGPSITSTQEGPRESKSPTAPSPPSPPLASPASTAPGDDASRDPKPERALTRESSFAATAERGEGEEAGEQARPPSPLEAIVRRPPTEEAPPSLTTTVSEEGEKEKKESVGRPSSSSPPPNADGVTAGVAEDTLRHAAPRSVFPLSPSAHTHSWVPPRLPSFWGTASREGGGGEAPPQQQQQRRRRRALSAAGLVDSPSPGLSSYLVQQQQQQQQQLSVCADDDERSNTIAELRSALRMHESLLQQLMAAQEEARAAKAAQAEAEQQCLRVRQSLEATETQLDSVSRTFAEALQSREAELQQQYQQELNVIQDAFEAYDKRMNSFVDQMRREFQEERRQWRQERNLLQSLMERRQQQQQQHSRVNPSLATSPPLRQQQPQHQSLSPERSHQQSFDEAKERVEARLRLYNERRSKQRQHPVNPHSSTAGLSSSSSQPFSYRRALQTPSSAG